jgi:hypothetical protein
MASIYQVTAIWAGFQGAPGYSKFAFSDLTTDAARNAAGAGIRSFFEAFKAYLYSGWSVAVQAEVLEYNAINSDLVGVAAMTTVPAATVGTATPTTYAGGSGAAITWSTGVILAGHRVKGRTFLVPVVGANESDGTLLTAARTAMETGGNALIAVATADFCIWGKTWAKDSLGHTIQPPQQTGGQPCSVISCSVKDMAAQLRSRRL